MQNCAKQDSRYNSYVNIYGYYSYTNMYFRIFSLVIDRAMIWESKKNLIKNDIIMKCSVKQII